MLHFQISFTFFMWFAGRNPRVVPFNCPFSFTFNEEWQFLDTFPWNEKLQRQTSFYCCKKKMFSSLTTGFKDLSGLQVLFLKDCFDLRSRISTRSTLPQDGQQSWSVALLICSEVLYLWDQGCSWQQNNSKPCSRGFLMEVDLVTSVPHWIKCMRVLERFHVSGINRKIGSII